jgi:hypothetical protein
LKFLTVFLVLCSPLLFNTGFKLCCGQAGVASGGDIILRGRPQNCTKPPQL